MQAATSLEKKAVALVTELSSLAQTLRAQVGQHQWAAAEAEAKRIDVQQDAAVRVAAAEAQVQAMTTQFADGQAALLRARQELRDVQSALTTSQAKKVELVTALTDAHHLVQQQDATVARYKRAAEEAERRALDAQAAAGKHHDVVAIKEAQLADHTATIQQLKAHKAAAQEAAAATTAELASARRQGDAWQSRVEELQEREHVLTLKWQNAAADVERLETLVDALREQLEAHAVRDAETANRLAVVE